MSTATKSSLVRAYSFFFLVCAAGCSRRSPPEVRTAPVAKTPGETVPGHVVVPRVSDAAAVVSARPQPSVPVSSASAEGPPAAPRDLPPARPCGIAVSLAPGYTSDDCLELDRVQPAGTPLTVCFARAAQLSFRYDDKGRIVESPDAKYTYGAGREGTRTRGGRGTKLLFDSAGRLVQDGAERLRYDTLGRLVRTESGGRYLAYVYAPDDTYTTTHNYPDRDEFCVADRVEVVRDPQGRVARDRYDHCGINEIPRTLHYRYGSKDELEVLEVDLQSDSTIEATLKLRYECR